MGARGPKATGSVKTAARLSASLRQQLEAAAAKRGKQNISQEIEHRLNRTFLDDKTIRDAFGDDRAYGVMRLLGSVIRSVVGRQTLAELRSGGHWLDDPHAYDEVVRSMNAVLELIRPAGEIRVPSDGAYQGQFNALATVLDVQKAPAVLPRNPSRHTREMVAIRKAIGDIVDRAVIHGATADQARKRSELAKEFGALRRKQVNTPNAMTNQDLNRMKALVGEIEKLLSSP